MALGSAEGFDLAEKAINMSSKNGNWVLLKNVHLAPLWLSELEKKIHRLVTPHEVLIFIYFFIINFIKIKLIIGI